MAIDVSAAAKINLTLHVVGRRDDGYHLLDSLVVFADVSDRLSMTPADNMGLTVYGPFAAGVPDDHRNLVWQAAECAGTAWHIHLEKNLPHGAGIGGGSSDAAAVLRALEAPEHAASLGADVPVCLSRQPQRMRGIGEQITPVMNVPAFQLVLVNSGVHLSTPAVFQALKNRDNAPMDARIEPKRPDAFLPWLKSQRNDLEAAALSLAPDLSAVFDALSDALMVRMSGSGATVFGIYPDAAAARAAAERIREMQPDWWVVATQTYGSSDGTSAN